MEKYTKKKTLCLRPNFATSNISSAPNWLVLKFYDYWHIASAQIAGEQVQSYNLHNFFQDISLH